jgi:hypothetical protein
VLVINPVNKQEGKIADYLGEIQKFLDCDNKTGLCLQNTIRFFNVWRIFGQFDTIRDHDHIE